MKKAEATGKSVDVAIENGLKMLNLTAEQVDVQIIEEGGLLKKAKVVLTEKLTDLQAVENFLEDIIAKMNFDCIVAGKADSDGISVSIVGKDAGNLIGFRGEVLDSLQYLASLYINAGRKDYVRVSVDAENYRAKRIAILQQLASNLEKKVVRTNRYVKLEPMNSVERRVIHTALQDSTRVRTESAGEEPNRYVIIYPKAGRFSLDAEPQEKEEDTSSSRKKLTFVYRSEKKKRR